MALSGTDAKPAIDGFNPGVGADLYTTNGETTDFAHAMGGALAWTPELGDGPHDDGFVFPDKEGNVQHEFSKTLPFACRSPNRRGSGRPGLAHQDRDRALLPERRRHRSQKSWNPMSDFRFAHSYNGADQPVQVLASATSTGTAPRTPSRSTTRSTAARRSAPTPPSGRAATATAARATSTTTSSGDRSPVPARATPCRCGSPAGARTSDSFTFEVVDRAPKDVLVVAAEDYTGTSNVPAYPATAGPPLSLDYYTDALTANGVSFDVYDVDARGRTAPDHLGVLGHYDAVVWYTGNDLLTREPGQPGGTGAATLANNEMLELRAYLNEGGRLLYTGRSAGWQYANAFDYNPVTTPPFCDNVDQTVDDGCLLLSDDFLQYWLGAQLFIEDGGTNAATDEPFRHVGNRRWAVRGDGVDAQRR